MSDNQKFIDLMVEKRDGDDEYELIDGTAIYRFDRFTHMVYELNKFTNSWYMADDDAIDYLYGNNVKYSADVLIENEVRLIRTALQVAIEMHRHQYDKAGNLYIFHPITVSNLVKKLDGDTTKYLIDQQITAYLHDVAEDTPLTIEDIRTIGFNDEIITALSLLKHDKEKDSYDEYIKKVETNELAMRVKLADLTNNSDLSRFKDKKPDEKAIERRKKYLHYIDEITGILNERKRFDINK